MATNNVDAGTLSGTVSLLQYTVSPGDSLVLNFNTNPSVTQVALKPSDLLEVIPIQYDLHYEQNGVIGVDSTVTFTPGGSISGTPITVEEEVGAPIWITQASAQVSQMATLQGQILATFEAEEAMGDLDETLLTDSTLCSNIVNAFALLTQGTSQGVDGLANDNNAYTQLEAILAETKPGGDLYNTGSQYRSNIVTVLNAMINIAGNWDVDEYFVNGVQVSVFDLWNGFNWAVNPTTSKGTVTISDASETIWTNANPSTQAYPLDLSLSFLEATGGLVPTGVTVINGQVVPVYNLIGLTNFGLSGQPTQYKIEQTSNAASGHLVVNGVTETPGQNITLTPAQLATATFVSGSGTATLQFQAFNGATGSSLQDVSLIAPGAKQNFNSNNTSDILFRNDATGDTGFYQISNGANSGWRGIGASSTAYSIVGTGDFIGNGTADILFRNNTTGDTGFYQINNGASTGWVDVGTASTAYSMAGVGDFTTSGVDDILFRNNSTGDTGYYAMSNGVNLGWNDIGASSTAYTVVGIGDFTGNGFDDILFRNNATGDTGFYGINNGVNTGWHDIGATSTAYSVVGIGDFNGNGTDDLLFRNNSTGDTGFYAISNGANTGWHDIGATSTAYSVVATGDYTGSGTSDILFRNNTTGDTGFYQMANGANTGWHDVGASSTAYHVAG